MTRRTTIARGPRLLLGVVALIASVLLVSLFAGAAQELAREIRAEAPPSPEPGRPAPDVSTSAHSSGPIRAALAVASSGPLRDSPRFETAPPAASVSERAYLEGFVAALRRSPSALDELGFRILDGPGPDNERVALLRAAWEEESPVARDLFLHALRTLPDEAADGRVSVPRFALRFLVERARQAGADPDRLAWHTLLEAAWCGRPVCSDRLRCVAVAGLVATANEAELDRIAAVSGGEASADVSASLAAALIARRRSLGGETIVEE